MGRRTRGAPSTLPSVTGGGVAVEARGVAKRYFAGGADVTALGGVDLSIDAGALVAIVGPSGSGKSTLLHLLGAMDTPDEGTIHVGGTEVTALSGQEQVAYRRRVGFVFQRFHLLPALTAIDNVAAPLLPYRTAFDKHDRARELLAAVGLAGRERSLPSELSGGQQQRVAVARALASQPEIIFADEPTGNLDSKSSAEILQFMRQAVIDFGQTIVMVTHDPIAAAHAGRIVFLADGRIVDEMRDPTPDDVLGKMRQLGD